MARIADSDGSLDSKLGNVALLAGTLAAEYLTTVAAVML